MIERAGRAAPPARHLPDVAHPRVAARHSGPGARGMLVTCHHVMLVLPTSRWTVLSLTLPVALQMAGVNAWRHPHDQRRISRTIHLERHGVNQDIPHRWRSSSLQGVELVCSTSASCSSCRKLNERAAVGAAGIQLSRAEALFEEEMPNRASG